MAKDTTIEFPAGVDSVALAVDVPLPVTAPAKLSAEVTLKVGRLASARISGVASRSGVLARVEGPVRYTRRSTVTTLPMMVAWYFHPRSLPPSLASRRQL